MFHYSAMFMNARGYTVPALLHCCISHCLPTQVTGTCSLAAVVLCSMFLLHSPTDHLFLLIATLLAVVLMQCHSPTDHLFLAVLLTQSIYTCIVCMSSCISNCSVAFTWHTSGKRLSPHDHALLSSYFLATCTYDMCTTIQETLYRLLVTWIIQRHYFLSHD